MKHIIATILVLCLCAGLWACSSPKKAEAKPQPTTEQNMLTQVKLGAPRSQAEKVFGASKEKFIPINKEALAKGAEAARNM